MELRINKIFFFMVMMFTCDVSASVVMLNTRVIYHSSSQQESIQMTNQDDVPNVMQIWTDSGDVNSTPETAKSPFIVTPPVFRIEPEMGQTVRIMYSGDKLPQDRESIFYLNALQIPPVNPKSADQNKMLIMLKNRVKIFYRPDAIAKESANSVASVFYKEPNLKKMEVTFSNASRFYVSVVNGVFFDGTNTYKTGTTLLSPLSESTIKIVKENKLQEKKVTGMKLFYVDDFGATREKIISRKK